MNQAHDLCKIRCRLMIPFITTASWLSRSWCTLKYSFWWGFLLDALTLLCPPKTPCNAQEGLFPVGALPGLSWFWWQKPDVPNPIQKPGQPLNSNFPNPGCQTLVAKNWAPVSRISNHFESTWPHFLEISLCNATGYYAVPYLRCHVFTLF